MTLFSHRLYFVCFCLSYYYTPVYILLTYKTTLSEKIPLRHLLYLVHTFTLQILGTVLQSPLIFRPCPRLPVLHLEPTTHSPQPRLTPLPIPLLQRSHSIHFSERYAC